MGGGFALMLAPGYGYGASAVNYGAMNEAAWDRLSDACPIVASYGGDDPTLKGMAARLARSLTAEGVNAESKQAN